MKKIKKLFLWLWLLTKRLYAKPAFLAILVLIPLLVFGYSAIDQNDSGMVVIALAGAEDPLTEQIFQDLHNSGQLMKYKVCQTAEEAQLLVRTGKVDGAWIFPEDLQTHIDNFVTNPEAGGSFVRVIQREESVANKLARERLSGVLYPHIARSYYIRFIRNNYEQLAHLSDEELLTYYDGMEMAPDLFAYDDAAMGKTQQIHYLTAPLRGLLAVVMSLGAMAAAMYTLSDRQKGTFCWLPAKYQILPELGTQWLTALHLGTASVLALVLAGVAAGFFAELITLLLYSLCIATFGMLLRRLLGRISVIGTAIPLLIVAMLSVCPVFFDLGALRRVQLLLPPTYYINSAHNPVYLVYMAIYTLLCMLICLGFDNVKNVVLALCGGEK